ncbi:MAG: methyltransferase domain-containing protein [Myxococcota bacterium]
MGRLPELLALLACPHCAGGLRETAAGLACAGCGAVHPRVDGVPDLRPGGHSRQVEQAFSRQWRWRSQGRFEDGAMLYGAPHAARARDVELRLARSLARAGSPWLLDAGCGSGEMTADLAARHPRVRFVGIDLCDSVRAAAARFASLPNLHYVQADVARPPFRPAAFDAAWSFGVLHHTPDTGGAFRALAALVKPEGALSIWLYPHRDDLGPLSARERLGIRLYYGLRDGLFAGRGHRLRSETLLRALRLLSAPARWLPLPVPADARAAPGAARPSLYQSLVFVLYDGVAPEYQHRHRREEVLGWFDEAGFRALRAGPGDAHSAGAYTGTRGS